jgi:hypothetical protein
MYPFFIDLYYWSQQKITMELKMTSSLANFISSLVAGGLVVLGISVALIIISKSDRVTRS